MTVLAVVLLVVVHFGIAYGGHVLHKTLRENKQLRDKLKRLSATDDEIMCILDATDSPLAKKLLLVANERLPKLLSANEQHFEKCMSAFRLVSGDADKLKLLKHWKDSDFTFSHKEQTAFLRMINGASFKVRAVKLLDEMDEDT